MREPIRCSDKFKRESEWMYKCVGMCIYIHTYSHECWSEVANKCKTSKYSIEQYNIWGDPSYKVEINGNSTRQNLFTLQWTIVIFITTIFPQGTFYPYNSLVHNNEWKEHIPMFTGLGARVRRKILAFQTSLPTSAPFFSNTQIHACGHPRPQGSRWAHTLDSADHLPQEEVHYQWRNRTGASKTWSPEQEPSCPRPSAMLHVLLIYFFTVILHYSVSSMWSRIVCFIHTCRSSSWKDVWQIAVVNK